MKKPETDTKKRWDALFFILVLGGLKSPIRFFRPLAQEVLSGPYGPPWKN